jgi:hypothetical protein
MLADVVFDHELAQIREHHFHGMNQFFAAHSPERISNVVQQQPEQVFRVCRSLNCVVGLVVQPAQELPTHILEAP